MSSQFYIPRKNIRGNFFVFDPSESHHIARVLRKKQGDLIQIFDGEGTVSWAKITDISDVNAVRGELSSVVKKGNQKRLLKIYPALIRNERFEWMLEKVTELGARSIQPILTRRTLIHLKAEQIQSKLKRWQKILISAAKQCGRDDLPEIFPPLNFNDAIHQSKNDSINLILWEGEEKTTLSDFLTTYHLPLTTATLFVGPEGGFTIEEVEQAKKAGIKSVRLGKNILRAETASLAAISLILIN